MESRLRARLLAFLSHLLASAVVITLFSLVVYLIWYPDPYHIIHSTWDVIKVLVAVDVVLGPLLTLVLFDIRKPRTELRRDIGMIVIIQLAALFWGGHVTYKMRPLVAAWHESEFYTVTQEDLAPADKSHPVLPAFYEKPKLVYVRPIEDREQRQAFYAQVLSGQAKPLMLQPAQYAELAQYYAELRDKGRLDLDALKKHPDKAQRLDSFLSEHPGEVGDYCYYRVLSGSFVGTLVMDCKQPVILGLIEGRF